MTLEEQAFLGLKKFLEINTHIKFAGEFDIRKTCNNLGFKITINQVRDALARLRTKKIIRGCGVYRIINWEYVKSPSFLDL